MNIPTKKLAEEFLSESQKLNSGPWVEHSRYTAKAAENIGTHLSGLDPETCYVLGLLHDIGRRCGVAKMRHIIDGYQFLLALGFDGAARICLTHSFPYRDTSSAFGDWDCLQSEREFVDSFLSDIEYTDYDRLIQLCDYLALPSGYCLMEKRMIDVAVRYGTNKYAVLKWKELFSIKDHFESRMGKSIYSVLPGVVENTFEII